MTLANLHVHNPIPVAAQHYAFVLGLALVDALDDESNMVNFLSFDGFVFFVLPSARERETRVVHLARIFRDVVTKDVVDTSERIRAGLGQFGRPKLDFLAVK